MIRVLSLGAGVQSSALLLMSLRGVLPRLDAAIFADTQYEPRAVYEHLEWLKGEAARGGIPLHIVTRGNIREDALEFRQLRRSGPEVDRRFASIPLFVKNPDDTQGRIRRQCTSEYKIQPVEQFIKRNLLGLKPRQRSPREVAVEQWMGITSDEAGRAKPPGRFASKTRTFQNLFGESQVKVKEWKPDAWKVHTFPFLNVTYLPNRRSRQESFFDGPMTRQHVIEWLAREYPGRRFPRSACLCCPFRSNKEWKEMRDTAPEDFEDACRFDDEARIRDESGLEERERKTGRRLLVGVPYVHRQMIPLRMVNLDDAPDSGFQAGGCGLLEEACEGMCGV